MHLAIRSMIRHLLDDVPSQETLLADLVCAAGAPTCIARTVWGTESGHHASTLGLLLKQDPSVAKLCSVVEHEVYSIRALFVPTSEGKVKFHDIHRSKE